MSMSMSCSPSPSPQHHAAPSPAPALDLLDNYWFFSNTLASNKPPRSPPSTSTTTTTTTTTTTRDGRQTIISNKQGSGSGSVLGARKFLRTPSLPAPRRHVVVEEEEVVDDDDLNWSSIYQGVLRTRMAAEERGSRSSSALQRTPSMPVVPSSSSSKSSTPSMPKLRHSNSTTLGSRHQHIFQQPSSTGAIAKQQQQEQQHRGSTSTSTSTSKKSGGFQDKKWKSSSDLESIEVQGFRDLGFVFDKEELRESLADVLPGLKQQQQLAQPRRQMQSSASGGAVPRPYLSEAWQHDVQQQRRPALVRVQSSSVEMKDQLRMWAQAVACNVRHEC